MKGASRIFWTVTIGIASVVVVIIILGALQGNIQAIVGQSDVVDAKLAGMRISQATEAVSLSGSHGYTIDLGNEFETLVFQDGKILFTNPGMDDVELEVGHGIEGDFSDIEEICIKRDEDGMSVEEGECMLSRCEPFTIMGEVTNFESVLTCSHDNVFSYLNTSRVVNENFFTRQEEEPYIELDYYSCPDKAEPGSSIICHFSVSYKCFGGEKTEIEVSIGDRQKEKTFNCTGGFENRDIVIEEPSISDDIVYSFKAESLHHMFDDIDYSGEVLIS